MKRFLMLFGVVVIAGVSLSAGLLLSHDAASAATADTLAVDMDATTATIDSSATVPVGSDFTFGIQLTQAPDAYQSYASNIEFPAFVSYTSGPVEWGSTGTTENAGSGLGTAVLCAPGNVGVSNLYGGCARISGTQTTTGLTETWTMHCDTDGTGTLHLNLTADVGSATASAFGNVNGTNVQQDATTIDATIICGTGSSATATSTATATATNTVAPTATNTATPTNTSVAPTATNTATATATNTSVAPTATNTTEPTATNTSVAPTATNTTGPTATNTPEPTATNTSVAPTATNTSVAPTATNTSVAPTATPGGQCLTIGQKIHLVVGIILRLGAHANEGHGAGTHHPPYKADYDVNGDGVIDMNDLAQVVATPTCPHGHGHHANEDNHDGHGDND